MVNKYKKLVSDTVIFAIGNFTSKFIYFFLMPIYTMSLSTTDFGTADLLYNSLQIVLPILTLCMSEAVFRFTLDKDSNPIAVFSSGIKLMALGYIIALPLGTLGYVITQETYWLYFACLIIFDSLKSYIAQFTRSLDKAIDFAISGILGAVVLLVCTYYFLRVFKLSISGYLLSFIVSDVVTLVYLLFRVKIFHFFNLKAFDNDLLKKMMAYSIPLVPNLLSWWITNVSSRYVVAGYCGLALAGLFSSASKIPAIVNVVSSVFQQSWQFATIKEYQESNESDFYSKVFNQYSMLIFVFSSVITLLIPFISKFILLGEFYVAWKYTPLLLYSALLGCFSVFFGTFYSVVKKSTKAMTSTVIAAVINVILCLILIPFINIWGALIANVISYIAIVYVRMRDVQSYVSLYINWTRWIVCLGALLAQSVMIVFSVKVTIIYTIFLLILLFVAYHKEVKLILNQIKWHSIR